MKAKLRAAAEEEEQHSYNERMSPEWLRALAPLGTDWRKPHLTDAPYVLVVFEQVYGLIACDDGTQRRVKHYYVQESVGIAVGFLIAALHRVGLATLTYASAIRFRSAGRTVMKRFSSMVVALLFVFGLGAALAQAEDPAKGKVTTIHLDEYNGYFAAHETLAGLKPGDYDFVVQNKAPKMVGFLLQDGKTHLTLVPSEGLGLELSRHYSGPCSVLAKVPRKRSQRCLMARSVPGAINLAIWGRMTGATLTARSAKNNISGSRRASSAPAF